MALIAGVVNVPIALDQRATEQLEALHKLSVKATVTFTASGGSPTTKSTTIELTKRATAPPLLSKLGVSPPKFSLAGRKVKGRCVTPTKKNNANKRCRRPLALIVSCTLDHPGTVTFTFKLQAVGRRVNKRCVAPTRKNSKLAKCTRLLDIRGKIVRSGKAAVNRFTFDGLVGGRLLGSGSYELIATPTGASAKTVSSTIVL